jgi:hypothetical protein
MFNCPDCGGPVQTNVGSYVCIQCSWFKARRAIELDADSSSSFGTVLLSSRVVETHEDSRFALIA